MPYDRDRETLAEIRTEVRGIEDHYAIIGTQQRQVLDLRRAAEHRRANDVLDALDDTQRLVQEARARVRHRTQEFVATTLEDVTAPEARVGWITATATATSILLGIVLSAFVARKLVRPVRALVSGIRSVEDGDLNVELPVQSKDEVGDLTQSFNYFVGELRAKEQIKRTFGKYIDPRVLEHVILRPGAGAMEVGRREMTVAFSDLVGFTSLGEQLTPAGMVNVLNRHFSLQAEAIQQHQGVIDKFMGDAVMAFWGPPLSAEHEHAAQACRAALAQLAALDAFRAQLPELTGLRKNLPRLDLRIGLAAGDVVVGNIGSENSRSYTVMGDTVNLASRLESANRVYGTAILANEAAVRAAGNEFVTREVDLLIVKGKTEAARVFLERIARFRANPPPAEWDGAFALDVK